MRVVVSSSRILRQRKGTMPKPIRIEGYAIVSVDGMIADRDRHMVDGLKIAADAKLFTQGLDDAAVIVHGSHSHEQQAVSDRSTAHRRHPPHLCGRRASLDPQCGVVEPGSGLRCRTHARRLVSLGARPP